jgi:Sodium:sulfate symporter transmembrane region
VGCAGGHVRYIRENRLIAGANLLGELPPNLRQAALLIGERCRAARRWRMPKGAHDRTLEGTLRSRQLMGESAYGTETFTARDFVRTGFVLTIIALGLVMLLGATYWHWLGYV